MKEAPGWLRFDYSIHNWYSILTETFIIKADLHKCSIFTPPFVDDWQYGGVILVVSLLYKLM